MIDNTKSEEIKQYLSILANYIYISNKQGCHDINKICENFFGGLINIINDLKLINMNRIKVNFPAIDLGDKDNKISYQITSESNSSKVKECIKKFEELSLYNDYDNLIILILGKNNTKNRILNNGKYTCKIIDFGDLGNEIDNLTDDKKSEVYEYFKDKLDKKLFEKIYEISIDKNLLIGETIIDSYPFCYYAYGLGKVRVDAYLPIKESGNISVCFQFSKEDISGCSITLGDDELKRYFFCDCGKKLEDRSFVAYSDINKVIVDFPNNRFEVDMDTAHQIVKIIDSLNKICTDREINLIKVIGASDFEQYDKGIYRMVRVPKRIWDMMSRFANKHDYLAENRGEWEIFNPQWSNERIVICRNPHYMEINVDILVNITIKEKGMDFVDILWEEGYSFFLKENEGFNNKHKWKVDYTHDWIINEFIPYVLYEQYCIEKSIFKRTKKYEEFKSDFSVGNFGIKSLKKQIIRR